MKRIMRVVCVVMACVFVFASTSLSEADHLVRTLDADGLIIEIDAQVIAPDTLDAQPLHVRTAQWTEDELRAAFFPGRDIQFTTEYYHDKRKVDGDILDRSIFYRNESDIESLYTNSGGYLDYNATDISYTTTHLLDDMLSAPADETQLDGFSLDDALALVRDLASKLRIDTGTTIAWTAIREPAYTAAYAAYLANVNELDEIFKEKRLLNLPPQNIPEGYWVNMTVLMQGYACLQKSYRDAVRKDPICGSFIEAYVTRDGVRFFAMQAGAVGYELVEPAAEERKTSMDLEKAIARFRKVYMDILVKGPVRVEKIEYVYVPVGMKGKLYHFRMVPCWVFTARYGDDEKRRVMLNAITGKQIH